MAIHAVERFKTPKKRQKSTDKTFMKLNSNKILLSKKTYSAWLLHQQIHFNHTFSLNSIIWTIWSIRSNKSVTLILALNNLCMLILKNHQCRIQQNSRRIHQLISSLSRSTKDITKERCSIVRYQLLKDSWLWETDRKSWKRKIIKKMLLVKSTTWSKVIPINQMR